MSPVNKNEILRQSWTFFLCGTVLTIVFFRLNLNSICIISMCALWLMEGNYIAKWDTVKNDKLVIAYCLYFLLQLVGLWYTQDFRSGWDHVERKAGFLALPIILSSTQFRNQEIRRKVMTCLTISLCAASLYCLLQNSLKYYHDRQITVFFYHDLVAPVSQHAVYFSAYTFIAIFFMIREGNNLYWVRKHPLLRKLITLYLIVFLFLLSSKLITSVFLLFLLFHSWKNRSHNKRNSLIFFGLFLALVLAIFFLDNPVKKRFEDILRGDSRSVFKKDDFSTTYFTGLEFRVLQWRLTYELLTENKRWILGLSPGDTQEYLNRKYGNLKMYMGNPAFHDSGYRGYNSHNQLLEITLQSGILGLILLLYWWILWLINLLKVRDLMLTSILIVILLFFFIEAVFERQMGMVLTTLFPLLYFYYRRPSVNT